MVNYEDMTLPLLKEEAKKAGLKGISAMKKQELLEALSAQRAASTKKIEPSMKDESSSSPKKNAPAMKGKTPSTKKSVSPSVKKDAFPEKSKPSTKAEFKSEKEIKSFLKDTSSDEKPDKKPSAIKNGQNQTARKPSYVKPIKEVEDKPLSVHVDKPEPVKTETSVFNAEEKAAQVKEEPIPLKVEENQEKSVTSSGSSATLERKTWDKRPDNNNRTSDRDRNSSYGKSNSSSSAERRSDNGSFQRPNMQRSQDRPAFSGRSDGNRPANREQSRPVVEKPSYEQQRNVPDRYPERPEVRKFTLEKTISPERAYTEEEELMAIPTRFEAEKVAPSDIQRLDSGDTREGILEIVSDSFGFIRCDNYLPGENDVYVSPAQIRRFGLRTGDIVCGNTKIRSQSEKFSALLYIKKVNGLTMDEITRRKRFEDLTPVFPNERIHLETPGCSLSMRMVDLISPIGKGQRGMIVSPPKAGKTTLLKQIAKSITTNHPDMNLIILLIDERPEEVTDIKESISGTKVEVIYSTFDELPENHRRVSEMVIERAKRLVEQKQDVVILLDSITRLARAYNMTIPASGRTLSGGLDPAALHMPKKFFGAARNMREGGSLTVLATALVETGSRMDDVVFEEFKGTGNMELQLDRSLSERRVFPAIDLPKSSTRRDDLLLTKEEQDATNLIHRMFSSAKPEDSIESIIRTFQSTKNNADFIAMIKKVH